MRPTDELSPIFAADLSKIPAPHPIRSEGQKARTAAIREVFRALGIRCVSVTMARGSMVTQTDVRIMDTPRCTIRHYDAPDGSVAARRDLCPTCARNDAAVRRLEYVIHTAFTDLDNRSDSQSDYFDNPVFFH